MTRPSLQKRSALHHRRGLHLQRADAAPVKAADATPTPTSTPTPKATAPAPVADRPKEKTTATATTHSVLPLVPSISIPSQLGLVSISTTSSLPSSTPSTTSAVTPSVTTHSLPPTQSIPTFTPTTSFVVVHTTAKAFSSQTPSTSATAQASSGMSTISIIGGIGGAVGGTILLTIIIGFLLRRWRKRKALDSAFDSDQFRRSATLLIEKDDNTHNRPRPPSMFERKNVVPTAAAPQLPPPSAAYPYSDQPPASAPGNEHGQSFAHHGAVLQPPSFAAGNQYGAMDYGQGDPFAAHAIPGQGHEQPGYGAPPVPGTHGPGAYAPYGVDPRYPQYQHLPRHQQYSPPQNQQPGFGQGPATDSGSLSREESVSSLANPFSPVPVPTKMPPTDGSVSSSPTLSSQTELTRGASFVTRQPQEAPPAYMNNEIYTDVKRDVKVSPSNSLKVVNRNSNSTKAVSTVDTTTTTTKSNGSGPELRPLSSYTLYNDDDAYGGM